MVTRASGYLNDDDHLFVLKSILRAFNVSHGVVTLPSECSAERTNLLRTQYSKFFIFLGEHAPQLKELKCDVDLEIQAEVIEHTVDRLQMTVGGFLC